LKHKRLATQNKYSKKRKHKRLATQNKYKIQRIEDTKEIATQAKKY